MQEEKVYLITGSSQGIGLELARQLLKKGNKVCLNGRSLEKFSAIQQELTIYNGKFHYALGDIGKKEDADKIANECIDVFGKIDALILNAGISNYGKILETDPDVVTQVFNTNLLGNFYLLKSALPQLISNRGSILFISSLAGIFGLPDYAPYSASKMALTAMYQSLQIELKGKDIFVGITFVGFTENEKSKRTYSPDGKLEEVPNRKGFSPYTREETARKIIHQLEKKKNFSVHSFIGKTLFILSRLSPSLLLFAFKKVYKKTIS